jgi:hypothetical protein
VARSAEHPTGACGAQRCTAAACLADTQHPCHAPVPPPPAPRPAPQHAHTRARSCTSGTHLVKPPLLLARNVAVGLQRLASARGVGCGHVCVCVCVSRAGSDVALTCLRRTRRAPASVAWRRLGATPAFMHAPRQRARPHTLAP